MLFGKKPESFEEVTQCAKKLHAEGIAYVVISLGKDGALLVCDAGMLHAKPPQISAVNTVGCGDSMVGAFAVALERKLDAQQALRYAVSVASANACAPETGRFEETVRAQIFEQIQIEKIL